MVSLLKIHKLFMNSSLVQQAEKSNTELNVIFEYADLLRYNREFDAAYQFFRKLEGCYRINDVSPGDYLALYVRMRNCCARTGRKASALPYFRKVLEFSLKLEEDDPVEKSFAVPDSLFQLADLDWQEKSLTKDFRLFQCTLESIEQIEFGDEDAYNELKAIVRGYIAICEAIRNGVENKLPFLETLELFQSIHEKHSCFKWVLKAAICCERLAAVLKTYGDAEMSIRFYDMQYRILKREAGNQFPAYGPEYFLACDNLAHVLESEKKLDIALEFAHEALIIRLKLADKGIETLPEVELSFGEFFSTLLASDCTGFTDIDLFLMASDYAKTEQYQKALQYIESIDIGPCLKKRSNLC